MPNCAPLPVAGEAISGAHGRMLYCEAWTPVI